MLGKPPVYDDLYLEEDLLREALGKDLEFSPNGNSINVSFLSPKLRVLIIIMFLNLYPLSSTEYMNLGRALFFHILRKNVVWTNSRICIPFCCLVSRILKLKGICPSADESYHPKPSPINLRTLNALVIAKRESNQNHKLHIVDHVLPHTPLMKS